MKHLLFVIVVLSLSAGCAQPRSNLPPDLEYNRNMRPMQKSADQDHWNKTLSLLYLVGRDELLTAENAHQGALEKNSKWLFEVQIVINSDDPKGKELLGKIDLDALDKQVRLIATESAMNQYEATVGFWYYRIDNVYDPRGSVYWSVKRKHPDHVCPEDRVKMARQNTITPALQEAVYAWLEKKYGYTPILETNGYPTVRRVDLWWRVYSMDDVRKYILAKYPTLETSGELYRIYDLAGTGLEWKQGTK